MSDCTYFTFTRRIDGLDLDISVSESRENEIWVKIWCRYDDATVARRYLFQDYVGQNRFETAINKAIARWKIDGFEVEGVVLKV